MEGDCFKLPLKAIEEEGTEEVAGSRANATEEQAFKSEPDGILTVREEEETTTQTGICPLLTVLPLLTPSQ